MFILEMIKKQYLKQRAKFNQISIITRLFVFSAICFMLSINFLLFSYNPAYAIKLQRLCKEGKNTNTSIIQSTNYSNTFTAIKYSPTGKIKL